MNSISFKVRDLRKKEQFIVDDVYLNGYAKILKPTATAVYLSLCRRANKEQSCYPSEKTIGADHGISDRVVRTHIKRLTDANIIKIERKRSKSGKWAHNVYFLLDRSIWKKPEEILSAGHRRKNKTSPEENYDINQRKSFPPKDAQGKETHNKDYVEKYFKPIPVPDFEPNSNEEYICHEIAKNLGEKNMNFILSRLKEYGLNPIEKAYGILKENLPGKKIQDKRPYFNAIISNVIKEGRN